MALCGNCREDYHNLCQSKVHLPRNDRPHKTRRYEAKGSGHVADCECVCGQPEGWRGTPQPLPRGPW